MAFPEDMISGLLQTTERRHSGYAILKVLTRSWAEPVTLEAFKKHAHITHSVEDVDIAFKLTAARVAIEGILGIAMMETVFTETYSVVPRVLRLTMRDALSVVSVQHVPNLDDDTWITYDPSLYIVEGQEILARSTWPTHRGWRSFKITYKSGYANKGAGDAAALLAAQDAVPQDLKLAIFALTSYLYENRSGEGFEAKFLAMVQRGQLPPMVTQLLTNYLDWGV